MCDPLSIGFHRLVPYCSSDSWSGAQGPSKRRYFFSSEPNTHRFSFMGSYIVSQVVNDLLPQGLINGSKLILAGSRYALLNLITLDDFYP